ncbi:hypothetical protein [Lysobacter silvisoli]|uniref:Uncharacterized protein n=1 Tax=Lysobacter silvisoli TaxID=2293254 RepID=A0A371K0E5_9GAMM|nr:hypothetical protein [Lysobacter silvisoli]RDZ27364.1 hypothetical protein DX914_14120 [Lysobacter silvisoli]
MSDADFDWTALGDEWRAQSGAGIDVDRLREEVGKRGRALRKAVYGELSLTVATLAAIAWLMLKTAPSDAMLLVFALLIPTSIGFQAWSLWLRRRQLRDDGLDAAAMLELEIDRANTSLRYWRYGTWFGVLLILVVFAIVIGALPQEHARDVHGNTGALVGGGLGVLVSACMAWFKARRNIPRLAYLRELQEQLRDG